MTAHGKNMFFLIPKPQLLLEATLKTISSYNARLDRLGKNHEPQKIYQAPVWNVPFSRQHCIVPLTSFFESCTSGTHAGNIVRFTRNQPDYILLAAGIWDSWTDKTSGEVINSFAIITDDPTPFLLEVGHDRQPVFLNWQDADFWLNQQQSPVRWYEFLKHNQNPIDYQVSNFRQLKGWSNPHDLFS
jgi:putative SOS response-associated peptidase YedK